MNTVATRTFIFNSVVIIILALTVSIFRVQPARSAVSVGTSTCVKADIVAFEQAYLLNRFSAFVPAGMMYALRRDVVSQDGSADLKPGQVQLRSNKRPRPLVLRVNEGDCLEVTFTNLLAPALSEEGGIPLQNGKRLPNHAQAMLGEQVKDGVGPTQMIENDAPRTRAASFHIAGLEIMPISDEQCPLNVACGGDGSNVGLKKQQGVSFNIATSWETRAKFNIGSLAMPGQTVVTRWRAANDGAYFAYSMGAPVGGEGDGGQIGLGLFGSVNVEPLNSEWFRSQVTNGELSNVAGTVVGGKHKYMNIDYRKKNGDVPLLGILDAQKNIIHSDLNAIIVPPPLASDHPSCKKQAYGARCGKSFREFTVIFHDEVHAQQAFPELEDENNPLHLIKDGMGINYGVSSMGSLLMSTPKLGKNVGVAKNCPECRAEEFFLSSWANGDPALILKYNNAGKPIGALYPDDPSNVHHSYLGDNVRFRNLHAGPKETHVFHLHAHQWVNDSKDPNSSYLDSQTISPGATFSYDIEFGGSGNRNYTPGDSIFHCHLYPHFAQGMWELWRTHDAFTDGKIGYFDQAKAISASNDPTSMNLPDAEIATGTETPALVPLPGAALAPMPSLAFRGYPYYIPGQKGHRPPQPVLDFDVDAPWDVFTKPDAAKVVDGGLPRHVVTSGSLDGNSDKALKNALLTGGDVAQVIAQRVAKQDPRALSTLAGEWDQLKIDILPVEGTELEKTAMKYHEGTLTAPGLQPITPNASPHAEFWTPKAYKTDVEASLTGALASSEAPYFFVNGRPRAQGAPYANPCPVDTPERLYRAAFIQTELTYNKHGWFDPQGRIIILENDIKDIIDADKRTHLPSPLFFRANSGECINFKSTNLVPAALNVDDFQIYTPTDTIGQHIHLVKFDVTSSDGSGNGFNYEDATYSPQEVRDRIFAYNRTPHTTGPAKLFPKTHPLFMPGGDIFEANKINPARYGDLLKRGTCPPQGQLQSDTNYEEMLRLEHPMCGAQRTTQRWWADPVLNTVNGKDNTLRTVFTHDHMGPSSHQQHGLYAGLVIEPANSVWTQVGAKVTAADIVAAADFAQSPNLSCNTVTPQNKSVCEKLIGGSNLSKPTAASLRKGQGSVLGVLEPREPLILRNDGGPTNTMANILAPPCIGNSDADDALQPLSGRNDTSHTSTTCSDDKMTFATRREFDLAIADFGISYNTALEPINPEPFGDSGFRDKTEMRFGHRHVPLTIAKPLAISSEDPGTQFFNYRQEPLALRISEASSDDVLGGWNYKQNSKRAILTKPCMIGDQDCLGDTANGFSTAVHAKRDEELATKPLAAVVMPNTRTLLAGTAAGLKINSVLARVEQWRRDFNCALYSKETLPAFGGCRKDILRNEPWRQFGDPATPILPAYEGERVQIRLIQGAQEAQHVFTMNGVRWNRQPGTGDAVGDNNSGFVNAQPIGISEHFEFDVMTNPNKQQLSDYLYFGSSTDQLWDGLWGIMRVFRNQPTSDPLRTSSRAALTITPHEFLEPLPAPVASETDIGGELDNPCVRFKDDSSQDHAARRYFEVSAVRVCDLTNSCYKPDVKGIQYNKRIDIEDESAVAYVLEGRSRTCFLRDSPETCDELDDAWQSSSNSGTMEKLRKDFANGRKLEPLVLRASAGQCIKVNLRNLLPPMLSDGPHFSGTTSNDEIAEAGASYNFYPMVTDGFNVNQFRMSSSVGISPTKIAQMVSKSDGSNVGLNSAVENRPQDSHPVEDPFSAAPGSLNRQGSLVPPCIGNASIDGIGSARCKIRYTWSATDFTGLGNKFNQPVEYGAIALRSFGDSLKQPGHGLIGALIIGPENSIVCDTLRDGDTPAVIEGPSVEICQRGGLRYWDHVLLIQDGIFATHGGLPAGNLSGAEEPDDYGVKGINYKTEPLWGRLGDDPSIEFSDRNKMDQANMLSSDEITHNGKVACVAGISPLNSLPYPCDPETPVISAEPGDTVRLHFVHAGGHTRQQGLAVSGHSWNPYPWTNGSRKFDAGKGSSIRQGVYNGFGPMMGITLELKAGGQDKAELDYLIRSQSSFIFDGGVWAILRVRKPVN
jgi:manganese oxidase